MANERPTPGVPGRVAIVQGQTRATLALALAFVGATALALVIPHRTGWWLPLHLFLAGALLLAISAATQLFAVTWAAGPPASNRVAAAQRWLLAGAVALLTAAHELRWPNALTAVGGAGVIAALIVLGGSLSITVRAGVQRRFDAAVRGYLCALAAGIIGCSVSQWPSDSAARLSSACEPRT